MTAPASVTAGLLIAAAACYRPNADVGQPCSLQGDCPDGQHCDDGLSPPTCVVVDPVVDAGPDAPIDAPVVACATGSACPPDEPVCDPTSGLCRGCRADAECTTVACEESTGQCVDAADVVYVDAANGSSAGSCTMADPCATIAQGVAATATGRTFVAIAPGAYGENVQLQGQAATVLSGPGSGAVASLGQITIFNAPAAVVIESVQVATTVGTCLQLQSTATTVTLYGDAVGPCSNDGVDAEAPLVVERCRLTGSSGGGTGVLSQPETAGSALQLDVEQTVIDDFGTAIQPSQGAFVLRNDLLSHSTGPALRLDKTGGNQGAGIVDFVTIVGGASKAITCSPNGGDTGSAVITSSLFAENTEDPSIDSSCLVSYSVWDDSSTPQGSNDGSGEQAVFVDANAGDYHLAPGSPGIDAADPKSTTTVDLDGAARPSGGGFDCGAFQGP